MPRQLHASHAFQGVSQSLSSGVMKTLPLLVPLAIAALATTHPARATTLYFAETQCPDGSTITVTRIASYSAFGQRIDGKPNAHMAMPMPLEICPDGFILYQQLDRFEAEELARARAIVATPEYQAVLAEGPSYLALHYLLSRMDSDPSNLLFILLEASWQVDEDRAHYEALMRRFASEASAHADMIGPGAPQWSIITARIVNAHRVIGEFDVAAERLAMLRQAGPPSGEEAAFIEHCDWLGRLIVERNNDIDPPPPGAADDGA